MARLIGGLTFPTADPPLTPRRYSDAPSSLPSPFSSPTFPSPAQRSPVPSSPALLRRVRAGEATEAFDGSLELSQPIPSSLSRPPVVAVPLPFPSSQWAFTPLSSPSPPPPPLLSSPPLSPPPSPFLVVPETPISVQRRLAPDSQGYDERVREVYCHLPTPVNGLGWFERYQRLLHQSAGHSQDEEGRLSVVEVEVVEETQPPQSPFPLSSSALAEPRSSSISVSHHQLGASPSSVAEPSSAPSLELLRPSPVLCLSVPSPSGCVPPRSGGVRGGRFVFACPEPSPVAPSSWSSPSCPPSQRSLASAELHLSYVSLPTQLHHLRESQVDGQLNGGTHSALTLTPFTQLLASQTSDTRTAIDVGAERGGGAATDCARLEGGEQRLVEGGEGEEKAERVGAFDALHQIEASPALTRTRRRISWKSLGASKRRRSTSTPPPSPAAVAVRPPLLPSPSHAVLLHPPMSSLVRDEVAALYDKMHRLLLLFCSSSSSSRDPCSICSAYQLRLLLLAHSSLWRYGKRDGAFASRAGAAREPGCTEEILTWVEGRADSSDAASTQQGRSDAKEGARHRFVLHR